MKSIAEMSVGELAAHISSHLRAAGIDTILSGGSCVSIYSTGAYVSTDLDFIDTRFATVRTIRKAMEAIGFLPEGDCFKHPDSELLVDFPKGPPAVGKEPVNSVHEITFETGVLRILSPTDCVKDRLAGYFYWNDLQNLEQAVLVAQTNAVDLHEIRRWAAREGKQEEFERIAGRLRR